MRPSHPVIGAKLQHGFSGQNMVSEQVQLPQKALLWLGLQRWRYELGRQNTEIGVWRLHTSAMKSQKACKRVRPGTGSASQRANAAAVQAVDSDDDFDDFLPTPAVATGSNAYELLLGGLDRLYEAPLSSIRSKPPKVKTRHPSTAGAPQERAADSTPAEQPLHDSNDASSSDDDADDRSGGASEEAADTAEVADQGLADFFSNHFDTASGPADYGKASSSWIEGSQSRSDWPGTTWLTTGQSFPQVCQHICLLAPAGNNSPFKSFAGYTYPLIRCRCMDS